MQRNKRLRIFAGPNGSGKSTLFSEFKKNNLATGIQSVYRAYLFDNSGKKQELIAEVFEGKFLKIRKTHLPAWFSTYVLEKFRID